jgi:hypothetical protein
MNKNKLLLSGLLAVALTFGLVLVGCGGEDEPSGPVYTVTVSPAAISMAKGASQSFSAMLKKDRATLSGSDTWAVSGGIANTKFGTNYDSDRLTIASDETTTTLTVTATITYSGTEYSGKATVTVISTANAAAALTAIRDATDADALLAALKAANAGIDQRYVIDANKAAYLTSKDTITSSLSSIAENSDASAISNAVSSVNWALQNINGGIVLAKFNAATSADAVKALLTEANFIALGGESVWSLYNGLSANGKSAVATAVYNGGTDYSSFGYLSQAISTAVGQQIVTEDTSKLDAAIKTDATLADIQAFMTYVESLGAPPITVQSINLAAIKAAIADAEDIQAYKNATGDAKKALAMNAVQYVYSIVNSIENPGSNSGYSNKRYAGDEGFEF